MVVIKTPLRSIKIAERARAIKITMDKNFVHLAIFSRHFKDSGVIIKLVAFEWVFITVFFNICYYNNTVQKKFL